MLYGYYQDSIHEFCGQEYSSFNELAAGAIDNSLKIDSFAWEPYNLHGISRSYPFFETQEFDILSKALRLRPQEVLRYFDSELSPFLDNISVLGD